MTTEPKPRPDKIIAYFDGFQVCVTERQPTEHDVFPHAEYIRADRAEPVNRQMLDALKAVAKTFERDYPVLVKAEIDGIIPLSEIGNVFKAITAAEQQLEKEQKQ